MTVHKAQNYGDNVIALLSSEGLPVDDLPATLENFIVTLEGDKVTGVAGLEIYGRYGLLRSLAVDKMYRGRAIASRLLSEIESIAKQNKLDSLFLLTETASGYFSRKAFNTISRQEVPEEVQASSEFSHVCPVSATVMKKIL